MKVVNKEKLLIALTILFCTAFNAHSQNLTQVSPDLFSYTAPANTAVSAQFDTSMVGSAAQIGNNFILHCNQQGKCPGTYSNVPPSFVFTPFHSLHAGEKVESILKQGIQSVGGTFTTRPYVWRFQTRATDGPGVFSVAHNDIASVVESTFAVGDLNLDGHLDVIVSEFHQQSMVYFGDGNGFFNSPSMPPVPVGSSLSNIHCIALGDINNDNYLDIAFGDHGTNEIYINDHTGHFVFQQNFGPVGIVRPTWDLEFADLDGDGDLDLLEGYGDGVSIYENLAGVVGVERKIDDSGMSGNCVAVGDLDNDFDLDFVVGFSLKVNAYENIGGWTFTQHIINNSAGASDVELGDLIQTMPPFLDLAIAYQQPISILRNDNFFNFTFVSNILTVPVGIRSKDIEIGDVNGDQMLDIAVGEWLTDNSVYLGNGTGTFTLFNHFGPSSHQTNNIEFGDFDEDGDVDIVEGVQNDHNRIRWNQNCVCEYPSKYYTGPNTNSTISLGAVTVTDCLGVDEYNGTLQIVAINSSPQIHFSSSACPGGFPQSVRIFYEGVMDRMTAYDGSGSAVAHAYPTEPKGSLYLYNLTGIARVDVINDKGDLFIRRICYCCDPGKITDNYDLYIEDTPYFPPAPVDTGLEPEASLFGYPMWLSRDMWIRRQRDGGTADEIPVAGQDNYVYVRIHNRGTAASSNLAKLHVKYTQASAGLSDIDFTLLDAPSMILSINPGFSRDVCVKWAQPLVNPYDPHICFLGIIDGLSVDPYPLAAFTWPGSYVRNHNNVAWRNVFKIAFRIQARKTSTFLIANAFDVAKSIDLEFADLNQFLDDERQIKIELESDIFQRWREAGAMGEGIQIDNENSIRLVSSTAKIAGIPLDGMQKSSVKVVIDVGAYEPPSPEVEYYMIRFTQIVDGENVGGVSFNLTYEEEQNEVDDWQLYR